MRWCGRTSSRGKTKQVDVEGIGRGNDFEVNHDGVASRQVHGGQHLKSAADVDKEACDKVMDRNLMDRNLSMIVQTYATKRSNATK